jgi:hypothetical protein
VAVVVACAGAATAAAQSPSEGNKWTAPRTGDGQPDLQGVWANNNATPLQRPKQWANKKILTDQELAELKAVADQITENSGDAQFGDGLVLAALEKITNPGSYDPATGNYNQFWIVDREFTDRRTSLIEKPEDGRIPALTAEAQKRMEERRAYQEQHPADGPEDRPAGERCANFGVPKLGAGYNSYYQIFQSPTHVAILSEMAHDARIIPIDGRPHVSSRITQWNGDARGRWEGDTLVVETRNFSKNSEFMGSSENLSLVERFTRVGPNTLRYEVTISDPTTWTEPWTVMIPLSRKDEHIYEYACHEGNEGMIGILAGHRAEEREAAGAERRTTGGGR